MQRALLLPPALLLLLTLACFWPVGHLGFIGYDDYDYVYQNPAVLSGLNPDSIAWAFGGAHAGNWHPLTWLSHMLDCQLFGLNPREAHWVNLGFHAANTLLLFFWLQDLTKARWRGFFVAALFAVHPLHVQSVAWISERKDVLSGFFFLMTLLSYTRYCRNKNPANYLLVMAALALGLMAKPMLVTTPLVLLLLDFWPLARTSVAGGTELPLRTRLIACRPLLTEKIPLFLLCAASCLVTLYAQSSGGATEAMQTFPWQYRFLHAVVAYSQYLWKIVWPANLAIFYPLPFARPAVLAVAGSLLLLTALFAVGMWRQRMQPYILVGWAWFFGMLLPVVGLVQVGLQSMADRYTYLPAIGLFIAVVWTVAKTAARSSAWRVGAAGIGTGILLACSLDARHQLSFWRDNITLFRHVVEVSPEGNYMGYFYLGISYGELGELDSAARCLKRSLDANPGFELSRSRLGNVLLAQKKYAEAEPFLESEAKAHPNDFATRTTFGMALAGQQKYAAAQSEFQAALQLNPADPTVNQLAAANAPKAVAEESLAVLAGQLELNPSSEVHARAALAESVLGRYAEAAKQYHLALAQQPDFPEWLNNLAWLLATCPDNAVRNGPEAVRFARRACELTQYKQTIYLGTLAAAYAEAGQFDDAVPTAKKACDNASALGETDLFESNQKLLSLYQNHQPYHEATRDP